MGAWYAQCGDGEPSGPYYGGGEVDQGQAGAHAAGFITPGLVARAQSLGAELDALREQTRTLATRLTAVLDELMDSWEAVGERGHDILLGHDTGMTWPTLCRAQELYRSWSGDDALHARAYRLLNPLNVALGFPGGVVAELDIARALEAERGR